LARALGFVSPPLFTNIPGEPFIAMDVPRPDRQVVRLLPALDSLPSEPGLWIALGVSPSGEPTSLNLESCPHVLTAGSTGSGKTRYLKSAVCSLVSRHGPDRLQLVIIDPKAVDFRILEDLPHLRPRTVVTDATEAVAVVQEIVDQELPRRTELLRENSCTDLQQLRARNPAAACPSIVLIVDEFADLVSVLSGRERTQFEHLMLRLAQRSRSAGIHLVFSTQRPTNNFISGGIKANAPVRLAFRVSERVDSMVVLDRPGAECLAGNGDMLVLRDGRLEHLQGYFIDDAEIAELIRQQVSRTHPGEAHDKPHIAD
jgi:DNA segregation ATPase FtsK/SpoIIIE-like protein